MSINNLTTGCLKAMFNNIRCTNPHVQIIRGYRLPSYFKTDQWRLLLSDGQHFATEILFHGTMTDEILATKPIVVLEDYVLTDLPTRKVLMVYKLATTVFRTRGVILGAPKFVDLYKKNTNNSSATRNTDEPTTSLVKPVQANSPTPNVPLAMEPQSDPMSVDVAVCSKDLEVAKTETISI